MTPIHNLFSYYLQTNKKEEAANTCIAAQSVSKTIVITPICKQIRMKADTKLASDVVDILKAHPDTKSSNIIGYAYSAWIDVLCKGKMVEEVSALLKETVDNGLLLGNGTIGSLRRLKDDLEAAGKPVSFTVPEMPQKTSGEKADSQQ